MAWKNRLISATGSIVVLCCLAADAQSPSDPSPAPQSAIVEIHLNKHAFAVGEGIEFSLVLKSTGKGIYIAKGCGEAGGNVAGFSTNLSGLDGKPAETCGRGSVADYFADTTTPAQWMASEFIYLPAGRFIGWDTAISCQPPKRGKYFVNASYYPNNRHTSGVAALPETEGQVITKAVEAKSVEIEIR